MNRNLLFGLGAFLAVAVVGFFIVQKSISTTNTMPVPVLNAEKEAATGDVTPAREITVTGSEYSFNPASISVKAGEKIRLTFVNSGNTLHNLLIDELDIKTSMVAPGKSDTVEFMVEGDSTLTFYCGVGNHRDLGMEGEIKLEQ